MKTEFEQLLAELQGQQDEQVTLAKAIADGDGEGDDKAIQAAAGDGNPEGGTDADPDADGDADGDDDKDGDGQPMAKSIQVDGEEVQVVDADALIKSLTDLTGRVTKGEEVLAKALASMVETSKAQGEMIKSLQAEIKKLAGAGAGRKAVLTVHDKPAGDATLAKSQQDGITTQEFLAKSVAAFEAKKITGLEASQIDVCVRQGLPIDQGLIAKVLQQ